MNLELMLFASTPVTSLFPWLILRDVVQPSQKVMLVQNEKKEEGICVRVCVYYSVFLMFLFLADDGDVNIWSVELDKHKKVSMQEPREGHVQGFTLNELVIQLSSEEDYGKISFDLRTIKCCFVR